MGSLKNKRALVTGGGQGLGYTIVEHLIEAGADVAIHYFSSEAGALELKRCAKPGQRVEIFRADLTHSSDSESLVKRSADFLGGLDILINNAGDLVQRRGIQELDDDFWKRTMDINVTSMAFVTKAAVPWLAKASAGASIVNLSSLAGRKGGHPGSLAYSTAKGAVLTWTRALALELAPKGIRVNALAPGFILGTRFHATHTSEASAQATIQQIPLRRAGAPADVARAALFLASEYDGFITGATLDINGGVYCA
jgi:3-oxoacyl-[acyl-carrier protein] reductase